MKRATLPWILVLSLTLILVTACNSPQAATQDEHSHDEHEHEAGESMEGMHHMDVEPPDEFAALTNPFAGDPEAIDAGEAIFQVNCATCHGTEGKGDGPAAEGLDPKPAVLADPMLNSHSDGYLFWRVSKGGQMEPFNSAMPAWETSLTEDQRWQVISFVRTLTADADEHMHDDEHVDDHDHSG
ncbi:MAG TPA: cytochrome c [Candidatus Binatia bacterium]|nr:cytochrome c [Candidatus Binatia bacterium]